MDCIGYYSLHLITWSCDAPDLIGFLWLKLLSETAHTVSVLHLQTFPHFEPGKEMGYLVSCKVGLQNWNQVTKEWSCDSYPLRHSASCQGALRLCGPDLFAHSAGNQQPEPGQLVCFLLTYSHLQGSICFGPGCRQSIAILLLLSRFALHQIHCFGITAAGQSF